MEMSKLQKRIANSDINIDENFIELVMSVAKFFNQYTVEYILNEMKIPRFLSFVDFIVKYKKNSEKKK